MRKMVSGYSEESEVLKIQEPILKEYYSKKKEKTNDILLNLVKDHCSQLSKMLAPDTVPKKFQWKELD